MAHDFVYDKNWERKTKRCNDGSGPSCTNIGGIMDYLPEVCYYFSLLFRVNEILLNEFAIFFYLFENFLA